VLVHILSWLDWVVMEGVYQVVRLQMEGTPRFLYSRESAVDTVVQLHSLLMAAAVGVVAVDVTGLVLKDLRMHPVVLMAGTVVCLTPSRTLAAEAADLTGMADARILSGLTEVDPVETDLK
jgi:hypothetical protein